MAFDERLAERARELLDGEAGASGRRMFGGLCFMLFGNMALGIVGDEMMVRVGPEGWSGALELALAREMDLTGRSKRGMVFVSSDGIAEDGGLAAWVERGLSFAGSLSPKERDA